MLQHSSRRLCKRWKLHVNDGVRGHETERMETYHSVEEGPPTNGKDINGLSNL